MTLDSALPSTRRAKDDNRWYKTKEQVAKAGSAVPLASRPFPPSLSLDMHLKAVLLYVPSFALVVQAQIVGVRVDMFYSYVGEEDD